MPQVVDETFEREHGCTAAEWLGWLARAVQPCPLELTSETSALVHVGRGTLALRWRVLPLRAIALVRLPRLAVGYRFEGVDGDERVEFMRRFDLAMQRGGG